MSIKTIQKRIMHAVFGTTIVGATVITMSCTAVSPTAGVPEQSFECDLGICTCTGDADCNDMFESEVCGDIAVCDETGDIVTCECLSFSKEEPDDVSVAEEAAWEVLANLPTQLADATQQEMLDEIVALLVPIANGEASDVDVVERTIAIGRHNLMMGAGGVFDSGPGLSCVGQCANENRNCSDACSATGDFWCELKCNILEALCIADCLGSDGGGQVAAF